jgi:3-oxoacyl-[acyl-carrier protein] reductase
MTRFLITGAASGIGRHLAGVLGRRGHDVVATDRNLDGLAVAAQEDRWPRAVRSQFLDVTSPSDWEAALAFSDAEMRGLDVLLNVAGYLAAGYVKDFAPAEIDRHLDINVKGVVLGTRAAAKHMLASGTRGHIVNFGSLASLSPVPGLSLYCASKWAVRGFSLSAAVELEDAGIAVSLVCPDAVETPMLDKQKDRDEAALTFSGTKPLTVFDIEKVLVEHVLPKRPLEVTIPLSRGLLARVGGAAPGLAGALYPMMKKKGLAGQKRSRSS